MELQTSQIVVLRNGKVGIVDSILGKPWLIVFSSFTLQIGRFNEELRHKDANYDIMSIYDGSSIDNPKAVWARSFEPANLECVWTREEAK